MLGLFPPHDMRGRRERRRGEQSKQAAGEEEV